MRKGQVARQPRREWAANTTAAPDGGDLAALILAADLEMNLVAASQAVVETDENTELGESFVANINPAQRVRHGASRVGDDVRVTGVGLGLAGIQVSDPSHRQPGQVDHVMATSEPR